MRVMPSKPGKVSFPHEVKVGGAGRAMIYKGENRGRTLYYVVWWIGPKRYRLARAKLQDAYELAKEKAGAIHKGQQDVAKMKSSDLHTFAAADRVAKELKMPLLDIVNAYKAAQTALRGKGSLVDAAREYAQRHDAKPARYTVAEATKALVASMRENRLNDNYVNQVEKTLEKFAADFTTQIANVRAADVQRWIRKQGGVERSQNNLRSRLVMLGNYARDTLKALPKGEATEFSLVKEMDEPDTEVEIFPADHMKKVLAAAAEADNEEAVLWYAFGGFAGLRPTEAMRLQWEDVEIGRNNIRVRARTSKVKAKRRPPILPALLAWIGDYVKTSGPVFTHNASERAQYFARQLKCPIPFDGLRHSYGTFRVAATQDANATVREMGTSLKMLEDHYDRVATKAEGEAWFAIMPTKAVNVVRLEKSAA
jgi:integrase